MGAIKIETATGKVADLVVTDTDTQAVITGVMGISFGIAKNASAEDVVIATITIIPASVSLSGVEGAVKVAAISAS
jgi:F420-0:gamma-glutamyl ligase